MLRWYPGVLLRVVLELTYVPIAFLSIFVIIVLAERDTPWRMGSLAGPGPTPGFALVVGVVVAGWALLTIGWRGARTSFKVAIVVWHVALSVGSAVFTFQADELVLQGDAIGFRVSLGLLAPVFSATVLACTLVWVARDPRATERSVSPLQRRNKVAAGLAVAGVAIAAACFVLDQDEVGALVGFAATFAGHEAIRPLNPSAELHKALVADGSAPD